jgi:hypothetical protein
MNSYSQNYLNTYAAFPKRYYLYRFWEYFRSGRTIRKKGKRPIPPPLAARKLFFRESAAKVSAPSVFAAFEFLPSAETGTCKPSEPAQTLKTEKPFPAMNRFSGGKKCNDGRYGTKFYVPGPTLLGQAQIVIARDEILRVWACLQGHEPTPTLKHYYSDTLIAHRADKPAGCARNELERN